MKLRYKIGEIFGVNVLTEDPAKIGPTREGVIEITASIRRLRNVARKHGWDVDEIVLQDGLRE